MSTLYSNLGIEVNVIVSASYVSKNDSTLDPPVLFRAMKLVFEQLLALAMILLRQPGGKKGRNRVWQAKLKAFNIVECVSFTDNYDATNGLTLLLEKENNYWFDMEDLKTPVWKQLW
jgi:hypothetical protein